MRPGLGPYAGGANRPHCRCSPAGPGDRNSLRPQQGAGDGADAHRRRLHAHQFRPNVVDALVQRIPGIVSSDAQGNSFAPDIRHRGFIASPVQGIPQGLAVYMNGVRVNEAFGDTVNWDLIPTIAIGRADVWTNNPAFGLNALGGAVELPDEGRFHLSEVSEADTSGRTERPRRRLWVQYGVRKETSSASISPAQEVEDDGWRYQSPSRARPFLRRSSAGRAATPRCILVIFSRRLTISSAWSGRRRSN